MTWTYQVSTGQIRNTAGEQVGVGYAGGDEGRCPEGINNCDMQDVHDKGPLPYGPKADGSFNEYTRGVAVEGSPLGHFAIPLIPDFDNIMYGRGDFFCHGDTVKPQCASKGCTIWVPSLRHEWYDSDDDKLRVIP